MTLTDSVVKPGYSDKNELGAVNTYAVVHYGETPIADGHFHNGQSRGEIIDWAGKQKRLHKMTLTPPTPEIIDLDELEE